MKQVTLLSV